MDAPTSAGVEPGDVAAADLLDAWPAAALVVNQDVRVSAANAHAVTLADRPTDEIVGISLGRLLPATGTSTVLDQVAEVFTTGRRVVAVNVTAGEHGTPTSFDLVPLRRGGAVSAVAVLARPEPSEPPDRAAGESQALREALVEQQAATDRLRRVDEMRRTFLRAVSHELRTPLTAVVGYAETLRYHRDRLAERQSDELVGRLTRNAIRLRSLLDDLLDIDRLSRGTLTVDRREADLADVVLAALDSVESRPGKVRVTAERTPCRVDAAKVERIVDNLVGNALKHGGRDVTVWIDVRQDGGDALLQVSDDGPGMPEELRQRAFVAFEQGPGAAAAPSPGVGLGLTLVAEFASLHGGTVAVDDRPGGGARFTVRFPLAG